MSHVKLAGDVRRRHYDGKGFFASVHFGMEIFLFHPLVIEALFDRPRIIGFLQFLAHKIPPEFHFIPQAAVSCEIKMPSALRQRANVSRYHLYSAVSSHLTAR